MHRHKHRHKAVLLFAMLGLGPLASQAEIVQRQIVRERLAQPDSEGADVLVVVSETGCGGKRLRMNAGSLGMDEQEYAAMLPELAKRIASRTPLVVSLDACPQPGATGEAAVPVIRKIVGCSPITCQDDKARLYLDENLQPQDKRRSPYVLELPLPPGKQKNTWQLDIYTAQQGRSLRLRGQIDAPDYTTGNKVGGYTVFYRDGQIEKQVPQNARGMEHGAVVTYYPDGTLESHRQYRDGLPEGLQSTYHKTGKLREEASYRNGARADGVAETFDENGKLQTRMTYRDGKLEDELLTYFPNGTLASRTAVRQGKFHGLSTFYFRDGKLQSTATYVMDAPDGEELEYYPNGKLAKKRHYSDNGVLRSEQQYSEQGVLLVQRQWDQRQREQGAFRSWYDSGKPQQLIEYVDGVREGWSRTWAEDGTLEKECRFVAGEGCGGE